MKSYNWKKGILFFIICGVIGALGGILLSAMKDNLTSEMFVNLSNNMAEVLFWVACGLGTIGMLGYLYFNSKLKKENYSDEEDSYFEKHEKYMSIIMMCSTLCAVLNFTAFGLGATLEGQQSLVALFCINVVLAFMGEVSHISLIKKVRPELDADPLKVNFNRDHFDKMDEREKYKTGKACFKTITMMVPVYVALFLLCYALIMMFEVSPIICLPIGIIWVVQTIGLTYYSNKETK